MRDAEISRQITRYIKGKLQPDEVDQLWIEFLKDPTRYEDFIIEVHLAMLLESGKLTA